MNNYKKAVNDPEIQKLYKDKPFHMAVLHALSAYKENGYSLFDLPWFPLHNGNENNDHVKKKIHSQHKKYKNFLSVVKKD